MKIRSGFVSNSSSSSYIVTISKKFNDLNEFLADLYNNCWCAFGESEEDYFTQLEAFKKRWETTGPKTTIEISPFDALISSIPARPDRQRIMHIDYTTRFIDSIEAQADLTQRVLSAEDITVKEEVQGVFSLTYFTSMHNSFWDMHHLLQAIYFEYLINHGGATIKQESDNF